MEKGTLMNDLASAFVTESRSQLAIMIGGLLRLERAPNDKDNVDAIVLACQALKRGASDSGCRLIESFTQPVSALLDKLQLGTIPSTGESIGVLLACCDHLGALLDALAADPPEPDSRTKARGDALLALLGIRYACGGGEPGMAVVTTGMPAVIGEKQADDSADAQMIRVHAGKLNHLIDLVGELVIAGAGSNTLAQRSGQAELMESTSALLRLVEDIRESALQLRMVRIGETFDRYKSIVGNTARAMGKDIELVITGGETDLDKSVVEKLGDPLMHLLRNAIEHGIEAADLRAERGKPTQGRVTLNAYHDSGNIVIEVGDDGGGLPMENILQKALAKGLIAADATLSDLEIANLVFAPGLFTAEPGPGSSGRGLGMDVVSKNIQDLRGSVEVRSVEGKGSTFVIRLPLTLAIIDGFLVGVAKSSFVIPLATVVECIESQSSSTNSHYLNLRGEVLPYVRLRELFEVEGELPKRESVVVVKAGEHRAGIVVDALLGEFQTVIKPLGGLFHHLRGISGSTILGSGEVALILDVQALTQFASQKEDHRPTALNTGSTSLVSEKE